VLTVMLINGRLSSRVVIANNADLLNFIINHKLKAFPSSNLKNGG
jgi:hypothetical protein